MRDNVQLRLLQDPLLARVDLYCAERGLGAGPVGLRRARLREVLSLEARSDADLARMGLRRADILDHVFGDVTGGAPVGRPA